MKGPDMKHWSHPLWLPVFRWSTTVAALGVLTACGHLPSLVKPGRQLQATEVRQLFAGQTVTSRNLSNGVVSVSRYGWDGSVRQQREGRQRLGHWRVLPDGRICLRMEGENESCRWMRQEADGVYRKYRESHAFARPIIAYTHLKGPAASTGPSRSTASGEAVRSDLSRVGQVQRLLNRAGFDAGPVDGIWGRRTVMAWQRFQVSEGLPRTNRIDPLTWRSLYRRGSASQ